MTRYALWSNEMRQNILNHVSQVSNVPGPLPQPPAIRMPQPDVSRTMQYAKAEVDAAVEESKKSPEPDMNDFWTDIYYKGTEPPFMRGREREEVHYY